MNFKEFFNKNKKEIRIGVAGFSSKKFDEAKATEHLKKAFDEIKAESDDEVTFSVVSGWTNVGVPALAYKEAKSRQWKTVGIACVKAKEYEMFECDEGKLVGEEWGDESETFLNDITVLVRVGGGKQTISEVAKAKEMGLKVIEFDLEEQKTNDAESN